MVAVSTGCDFSPVKEQIKRDLTKLAEDIRLGVDQLDNEQYCMLGQLEQIKEQLQTVESIAASFYLNCYLSPYTDKYSDLSLSVKNLSERKNGALIVVQRNDSLDTLIHHGIPVEAPVSHLLLESFFYPGSPLHDGAVLIHENRIVSASNVLPLSGMDSGDRKLGTRHRAALGLTEHSDALILIVSEETGKVSFAVGGHLYPFMV